MGDQSESAALRAELMAASVVSAHNHVLRRWLRAESPDPVREVDEALRQVIELFTTPATPPGHDGTTIAVFRSGETVDALIPALRRLLEDGLPHRPRWDPAAAPDHPRRPRSCRGIG
jgi:hypothetical protein